MSVADDYSVETATGTTDPLRVDVPWDFDLDLTQLEITQQNDTTGEVKYQSLGDFTATVNTDDGVYINLQNFYGSGTSITGKVKRSTPKTQVYTLLESVALNPESLEDALDKLTKLIQEAIVNPNDDAITSVNAFEIADKVTRALKVLRFDASGNPVYGTIDAGLDDAVGYAEEWATKAEDVSVSVEAGGGPSSFSAFHYAAKCAASAIAAAASAAAAASNETNSATSETNAAASAAAAAASTKPLSVVLNYDNTVAAEADPGDENIRFNSATLASITEAYIDDLDDGANDISGLFQLVAANHTFHLQELGNFANAALFTVDSVTDQTGYTKLELTLTSSTGSLPANGSDLVLTFTPASANTGGDVFGETTEYTHADTETILASEWDESGSGSGSCSVTNKYTAATDGAVNITDSTNLTAGDKCRLVATGAGACTWVFANASDRFNYNSNITQLVQRAGDAPLTVIFKGSNEFEVQ